MTLCPRAPGSPKAPKLRATRAGVGPALTWVSLNNEPTGRWRSRMGKRRADAHIFLPRREGRRLSSRLDPYVHPTGNPKLLQWLVQHGLLSTEQQEQARSQQRLLGGRIEEAILDTGALDEPSLLKFLANTYRTRFVSSEKLARAQIDQAILELVPKKRV